MKVPSHAKNAEMQLKPSFALEQIVINKVGCFSNRSSNFSDIFNFLQLRTVSSDVLI